MAEAARGPRVMEVEGIGEAGGKKRGKLPRLPMPGKGKKREKPAGSGKSGEKGRGGGAVGAFIGAFLFFLVLDAAVFASLYFNLFGAKDRLNEVLNMSAPAMANQQSVIDDQKVALERDKTRVKSEQEGLTELKRQLDAKEEELLQKAAELDAAKKETDALMESLSAQGAGIDETVKLIEAMDSSRASALLAATNDREYIIKILKKVKITKRSEILELMSDTLASDILKGLSS